MEYNIWFSIFNISTIACKNVFKILCSTTNLSKSASPICWFWLFSSMINRENYKLIFPPFLKKQMDFSVF
jgi:hypothetical protein